MRFTILKIISCIIASVTLLTTANSQKVEKPKVSIQDVNELFKTWQSSDKPGIAVGIVNDGQIEHTAGYGLANLEHNIPITTDTKFYIGGLANQFTALALLMLEANGKLSLNDNIAAYLPEFNHFEESITIKDLIYHTSGIRDIAITKALSNNQELVQNEKNEWILLFSMQKQLNSTPGVKHSENNSAFYLLEKIIEKSSLTTYSNFIQKNILDPLGMTNTVFDVQEGTVISNKAQGYLPNDGKYINAKLDQRQNYSTNMYSSVKDMCKWIQNLYHPKVGGVNLINQFSKPAMENGKIVKEKMRSLYFNQFRYWDYNGTKKLYHISMGGGYACKIVHFPDQNISAIVLGNAGVYNGGMATLTGKLYVENYFTKSGEPLKINGIQLDSEKLQNFVGNYWEPNQLYKREIYIENDTLIYSRGNNYNSKLLPISEDKFQMLHSNEVYIKFEKRKNRDIMLVQSEGEGDFELIEYAVDDVWAKDLNKYVGDFYCEELNCYYSSYIENDKLVINVCNKSKIELEPIINHSFTSADHNIRKISFDTDDINNCTNFTLYTSKGDKLIFEKSLNHTALSTN